MKLWKMHGAGNDFLVTDNRELHIKNKSELAAKLCDRHFGIGADGFIALEKSDKCEIKMSFYNADGSEDTMCGNGIRCLSKFARDIGAVTTTSFTVETADGIKHIVITDETPQQSIVIVDMGSYSFDVKNIGIKCDTDNFMLHPLKMKDGRCFEMSCVRLGVNHGVIFVDDDEDYPLLYGSEIENLSIFERDMNVNFVKYIDTGHIKVKTWERGVGKTLACGTGCSSSALITKLLKKTKDEITVDAPGGRLTIMIKDNQILMKGPAVKVAEVITLD